MRSCWMCTTKMPRCELASVAIINYLPLLGGGREPRKSSDQNPFIPLIFKVLTTRDSFLCTVPRAEGNYNIKTFTSFRTCEEIPYHLGCQDFVSQTRSFSEPSYSASCTTHSPVIHSKSCLLLPALSLFYVVSKQRFSMQIKN
jgi:hypothetical protein